MNIRIVFFILALSTLLSKDSAAASSRESPWPDAKKIAKLLDKYAPVICGVIAGVDHALQERDSSMGHCTSLLVGLAWGFGQDFSKILTERGQQQQSSLIPTRQEVNDWIDVYNRNPGIFIFTALMMLDILHIYQEQPAIYPPFSAHLQGWLFGIFFEVVKSCFPEHELKGAQEVKEQQPDIPPQLSRRQRKKLEKDRERACKLALRHMAEQLEACEKQPDLSDESSNDESGDEQSIPPGCCGRIGAFFKDYGPAIYGAAGGALFTANRTFAGEDDGYFLMGKNLLLGGAICAIGGIGRTGYNKYEDPRLVIDDLADNSPDFKTRCAPCSFLQDAYKDQFVCLITILLSIDMLNSCIGPPTRLPTGILLLGGGCADALHGSCNAFLKRSDIITELKTKIFECFGDKKASTRDHDKKLGKKQVKIDLIRKQQQLQNEHAIKNAENLQPQNHKAIEPSPKLTWAQQQEKLKQDRIESRRKERQARKEKQRKREEERQAHLQNEEEQGAEPEEEVDMKDEDGDGIDVLQITDGFDSDVFSSNQTSKAPKREFTHFQRYAPRAAKRTKKLTSQLVSMLGRFGSGAFTTIIKLIEGGADIYRWDEGGKSSAFLEAEKIDRQTGLSGELSLAKTLENLEKSREEQARNQEQQMQQEDAFKKIFHQQEIFYALNIPEGQYSKEYLAENLKNTLKKRTRKTDQVIDMLFDNAPAQLFIPHSHTRMGTNGYLIKDVVLLIKGQEVGGQRPYKRQNR